MTMQWQEYSDLKQYFTDARAINKLMCKLLGSVQNLSVLEPSVGHGAFLEGFEGTPSILDIVDVDGAALEIVASRFKHLEPRVFHTDFINLFVENLLMSRHPVRTTQYDCVISNPPYGLYFDIPYRKRIKEAFPDLYARESYGLFFAFSVSRLKEGGRYVFLLPDTFLSSVNHRSLREFMCDVAAPLQIIRFPSKHFETVNFQYGNLCIIAGEKRALRPEDEVRWLDLFEKNAVLEDDRLSASQAIRGQSLRAEAKTGWSSALFSETGATAKNWENLGSLAECRTGIYTGDNGRFIGFDATRVRRRLNGHPIDWQKQVELSSLSLTEREHGLKGERCYVPFIRGGHREVFDKTPWAINWSEDAVGFYKSNSKARLQNARFYFNTGISVPMVTTKRISAAVMSDAIFDQGVVGVFPFQPEHRAPLLLYLNSSSASKRMKELVNGGANNSANYLKRLPVPPFSAKLIAESARILSARTHSSDLGLRECDAFTEQCEKEVLNYQSR